MKDDRQVYIISGRVVPFEDGTGINNSESDRSIIIRDAETGKLEQVSPEVILSMEEAQDPYEQQQLTAQAIRQQFAQEAANKIDGIATFNAGDTYTITGDDGAQAQIQVTPNEEGIIDNGDGTINVSDGTKIFPIAKEIIQQQVDAANMARVAEFEQQRAAQNAARKKQTPIIYKRLYEVTFTDENGNIVKGQIEDIDDDLGTVYVVIPGDTYWQTKEFEKQQIDNGLIELADDAGNILYTKEEIEETPQSINEQPAEAQQQPAIEQQRIEEQPAPQTALDRIPRDEQGNPIYEQAETPDVAWDALVELSEGDEAMALDVANDMVSDAKKAVEKAKKLSPKAGTTPAEKMAARKEIKTVIEAAENNLAIWQNIAQTPQLRRIAAEEERARIEAEQAALRKAEEERLKAEKEEAERVEREALNGIPDIVDDNPSDARARGYRRVNGTKVDRQQPVQHLQGKEVSIKFSNDAIPQGRIAVIDANQLQPSHIQGVRNPAFFIDEGQPKDRNDEASILASQKIAANIRPEEITSSVTAYTGAPVVNTRGEVIQGNNRSDALRYMWQNNPEQSAIYKQYLINNAEQFGLNAQEIEAMQNPVLVNMLDVDDANAIALGQYVAQDTESGGIERIKPKNAAQKMGNNMEDGGETETHSISSKKEINILDPRSMSDEEKQRRGDMLRNASVIDVAENQIVATDNMSARKAAEKWWNDNFDAPVFYDTEAGEVEINRNSIESSLAHRYSQKKLDAITSLVDGFENAVYLGTMPDFVRQDVVANHYFAYPINYDGKLHYVFCRAINDANKNRLYVHEVFVADNIKKGNSLQTAASQPHGGIALYRDILANVLEVSKGLQTAASQPHGPTIPTSADKDNQTFDIDTKGSKENLPPSQKREGENLFDFAERLANEEAQLQVEDNVSEPSPAQTEATNAVLEMLANSGVEVSMDEKEMADIVAANEILQEMKKSAIETVSPSGWMGHQTVVSSADGAKILNNLQEEAKKIENLSQTPVKTFIGDIAKALGMRPTGRKSQYGTFETMNSKIVTIRLSDHNSTVSNYDNAGVRDGISIIVTSAPNKGLTNDGEAHVTEVYYNAIKLRKADGKPLAEIVRSIEQALYSGEYKDTTGLAEIEEVNPLQFLKTSKGEVYGFVKNGKMYLDPKLLNPNTPIHEYTHIWDMALQKSNPELWKRGIELMKQTPLWDEVKNNPAYADIADNDNLIASEVHARLTGKEGAALLERLSNEAKNTNGVFDKAEKLNLVDRLKQWLNDVWQWVKDTMTPWTAEEAKNVSLEEFIAMTIGDLANGKRIQEISDNQNAESIQLNARRRSDKSEERIENNKNFDFAMSFITGKPIPVVREERINREHERRDRAKEIYENVLQNRFDDVTLQRINDYIDEFTPDNPFGRHISERLPQRVERGLRRVNKTNAVDALFSRISESAIPASGKTMAERGREIAQKKNELLEGWAKATGNWHTDITDFTNDTEPIGQGKDSDVYFSKDGNHVIKVSKGKNEGRKFISDIDAVALYNGVFPSTAYNIVGYGEIDGKFVKFLEQPRVNFAEDATVSEQERIDFMRSLGFEPERKSNTIFSNGEIVVADVQKGNIVRDNNGKIQVIDADVKLHTKDIGGNYTYPPATADIEDRRKSEDNDTPIQFRFIGEKGAANIDKAEESTIRLDNLAVARDMEKAGKDAKAIKMATGWERGADNKWRYEISDSDGKIIRYPKLSIDELEDGTVIRTGKLTDIFDAPDLYNAYPKLRETTIQINSINSRGVASYNSASNHIFLNNNFTDKAKHVLDRIKEIEQSPEYKAYDSAFIEESDNPEATLKQMDEAQKVFFESEIGKEYYDLMWGKQAKQRESALSVDIKSSLIHEIQHAIQDIEGFAQGGNTTNENYNKLSGEVEARNVQKRMGMTPEQRRKTLAEETEDVAREDQLFLYDGVGISQMGSRVEKRMTEIADTLKDKELTEQQRDVADTFGGLTDNKKVEIEHKGGRHSIIFRQGNENKGGIKHAVFRHNNTSNGYFTAEDILVIPEVLSNGDISVNEGKNVYKATIDGTEFTVITENRNGKEFFVTFYSNRKAPVGRSFNTQSAQTSQTDAKSDAKVIQNSDTSSIDDKKELNSASLTPRQLRKQMAERVRELADKLHLDNVEIVTDKKTLEGKRKNAKGFYNKRTGKITIVVPNNASIADVEQTLLHEAVAHYGLRQLFGDNFDTFLDNVFNNAEESIRREIVQMAAKNSWDFRTATEEYLAALAENTNFEKAQSSGWWQKVKDFFSDMLEKLGFSDFKGDTITDNELRYILWRSYENLKEGNNRGIFGTAADMAMQYELGIGEYDNTVDAVNKRFNEELKQQIEGTL